MSRDEGQEEYEETQAELKKYEDDVSVGYNNYDTCVSAQAVLCGGVSGAQ